MTSRTTQPTIVITKAAKGKDFFPPRAIDSRAVLDMLSTPRKAKAKARAKARARARAKVRAKTKASEALVVQYARFAKVDMQKHLAKPSQKSKHCPHVPKLA